jgi:hypothetical protein
LEIFQEVQRLQPSQELHPYLQSCYLSQPIFFFSVLGFGAREILMEGIIVAGISVIQQ